VWLYYILRFIPCGFYVIYTIFCLKALLHHGSLSCDVSKESSCSFFVVGREFHFCSQVMHVSRCFRFRIFVLLYLYAGQYFCFMVSQVTDSPDFINPLLEGADFIDGQLWVAGNRVLINLNLSRK